MTPLLGLQPRQRRDSVRRQPRPEAETSVKLKALVNTLHWKRAAILRYIMQWGLANTQRWTIDSSIMRRTWLDWEMSLPCYRRSLQLIRPRVGAMLTHGIMVLPTTSR